MFVHNIVHHQGNSSLIVAHATRFYHQQLAHLYPDTHRPDYSLTYYAIQP